ncbi:MAG TPA: hypothetical protein VJ805_05135 [Nitrospiraceae bacterium]|nr:hypothetical protein [Nitrospiraceae bacterium]
MPMMAWQLLASTTQAYLPSRGDSPRVKEAAGYYEEAHMGLIIWGLLIGMVGMIWLLVAASLQEGESGARKERDREQDQPSVHQEEQRAKAAA